MTTGVNENNASSDQNAPAGALGGVRSHVVRLVENTWFVRFIIAVIVVNAVTLGLETSPSVMDAAGTILTIIDRAALAIFTVEIALKLFAYGPRFFRSGWNVFDFVIVAISLAPAAGPFSVLRALRILRVLRLVSIVPQLKFVVGALFSALPGMGAIIAVLILVFYVAAVIATKLFGGAFPDWFGSIGASMYSLFQIMTLESWSMGIVRPVMDVYPWAWMYFVPFIIVTSFAVLNLFIALIVNSLQTIHDAEIRSEQEAAEAHAHDEREALLAEIRAMKAQLHDIQAAMDPKR